MFVVDVRAEKDRTAGLPAHLPVLDAAGSHTQHDCHLCQQVFGHQHQHQHCRHTEKKEMKIFLIFKNVQSGEVAKSYMRKGFLIYEEMRNYFPIYEEEAASHM